jgi:Spy/CpxP family protein refolding chaperone
MKIHLVAAMVISSAVVFFCRPASAQADAQPVMSTPPVTQAEKEAMYNTAVNDRVVKIMQSLSLTDAAKSNRVHDAITGHYRVLRSRDEVIDYELANMPAGSPEKQAQRLAILPEMSKPLHEIFVATLAKDLTAEQIEMVKDKMTYGKVEFTYSAYCSILPKLTDEEKAKIMALLKQARDVAMDGGNAGEKSTIFQQYKDQINAYLTSRGYDVAKATEDWSNKQKVAEKTTGDANSATPAK